ncbi:MAG: Ig-like domain-containing protein [Bryobacteraceae bacterium]
MRISGFGLLCMGALFALMPSTGRAGTCSTSCTTSGSTTTCTSTDTIKTPDEGANGNLYTANIYPSCITVPNSVTGTVSSGVGSVQVQLTNMDSNGTGNYLSLQGTEILLVAPSGEQLLLMGNPGDGSDTLSGLTMAIADSGTTGHTFVAMPNGNPAGFPSSGTQYYEPSSYGAPTYGGTFPSPGPGAVQHYPQTDGSSTLKSIFSGVTAAGTWDLYMVDDFGDPVTINGWQLALMVNASAEGTITTVTSSQQPAYTASPNNTVTFTATVTSSGDPVTSGTVAFYANGSGTAIACTSGNQTLNSSGQATCGSTLTAGSETQCTSSTLPAWPTVCQGNNPITATYLGSGSYTGSSSNDLYQLVTVHSTNPTGTQWCNSGPFAVPEGVTPLAYPSFIQVSGYSNTIANLTVALTGVAGQVAGIPGQFLLVAPDGTHNLDFLDEAFFAGGATSPVNLTMFDTAGQTPAGLQPTSGNYEAYDNNPNPQDTFPTSESPNVYSSVPQVPGTINYAAPRGGTSVTTFGGAFSGVQPNGVWALYAYTSESLTVNGGWCITFDVNNGAVTATSLMSSQQRATTGQSVTFTATVTSGGNPVTSGTVTFEDGGLTPAGTVSGDNVVTLNGSGQAVFTTSSLAEGDHDISAAYSGVSGTYDVSTTSMYQRIDDATTVSNVTSTAAQFCNTGGVTAPNEAFGAFTPNPSNIFVSNLWGTVSAVTVTLDGWDIPTEDEELYSVESLLAGPTGALDFFSVTDGTANASTGNYTFADTGSTLNASSVAPGTYKPAADDSSADTFFQDPGNFYTLPGSFSYAATHGSATLTSTFGSSIPNGTWSLYFNQKASATIGATSGWCLNFTENPVTVDPTTESTDSFTQGQQNQQLTLNIKNNGTGPTGDPTGGSHPLTVTDTLNSAFSYASSDGTGWNCGASGQTVSCTNDSAIAQGSSYPALTLNVNVSPSATPGPVTNAFNITGGAGVTATSSNIDTVTILPAPNLSVQKTHSGAFTQGSTAQWDISVSNTASGGATSGTVNVSDALPSGYTVANFGTTSSYWTCGGTTTITCTTILSVSGGSSFPLIQVIVNVPANSPTSVSNTALAWGGGDLNHTNSGNAATGSDTNVPVVQTPASISASGGSGQNTNVSTTFALPLQATVLDGGNNPINNVTVTFTAPGTGASGTFPGSLLTATAATNSSGVATSPAFTANATSGSYAVVGSVSGLTPTASFSLTNNALSQTITFNPIANQTQGTQLTLSATASSGLTVSFGSLTTGVCTVSGTTATLSNPGTCTIQATQAGNGTYSAAQPVNQSFTVLQTQTITFNPIANQTQGTQLTLSATASSGLTVSFASLTTGVCTVSGTTASLTNPGTCTIQATQAGNGTYAAAQPVNQSFTVLQTQTITFNPIANQNQGTQLTLSATASSGLAVSFASLTTGVCTVSGTTASLTNPGTCTIQATQAGNSTYAAAQPVNQSFTVLGTQTITFNPIPNQTQGTQLTLSATASSGLTVSFASLTTGVCTVSGTTASLTNPGTCTIQATQAGNGTYAAAQPVNQSFTVLGTQTITFNPIANQTQGTQLNLVATATPGLTVSFASLTTGVCTVSGTTASLTNPGTCTIQATQAGNSTYAAAQPVNQSFTVLGTQTITFNPIANQTQGTQLTLVATASSGLTVSFASLTTGVCTVSGTTASLTNPGTCTIQATQAGNATYAAAQPVNQSFTVLGTQTITFNPIANQTQGTQLTLVATATSGLPVSFASLTTGVCTVSGTTASLTNPGTCTIQATQAGNSTYAAAQPVNQSFTVLGTQTITFNPIANQTQGTQLTLVATATSGLPVSFASLTMGVCTVSGTTASLTNPGTCTIQATQAGNATYGAAQPVNQSFTVLGTQTITFNPIPTQVQGTMLNLVATASSGLPVSFASLTTGVCTVSGTVASLTNLGTCTIQATQAGNATYAAAQPVNQSFTVLGTQTITFNPIGNQIQGTMLNLVATASSGLTVSFASLTTGVCTVSGTVASLTNTGTCTIQASQSGNATYAPAQPVSQSFSVLPAANFTIVAKPSSETVEPGLPGAVLLDLQSVMGFDGNVTLSCAGGPSGFKCVDLPQTVHLDGTAHALSGVLFPKNTTPGTYTITFTGVSGSLRNSTTAKFTVK